MHSILQILAARSWGSENMFVQVNIDEFPDDNQPQNHDRGLIVETPRIVDVAPPNPQGNGYPNDFQRPDSKGGLRNAPTNVSDGSTKVNEVPDDEVEEGRVREGEKDGEDTEEGGEKAEPDLSDERIFASQLAEAGVRMLMKGAGEWRGGGGERKRVHILRLGKNSLIQLLNQWTLVRFACTDPVVSVFWAIRSDSACVKVHVNFLCSVFSPGPFSRVAPYAFRTSFPLMW